MKREGFSKVERDIAGCLQGRLKEQKSIRHTLPDYLFQHPDLGVLILKLGSFKPPSAAPYDKHSNRACIGSDSFGPKELGHAWSQLSVNLPFLKSTPYCTTSLSWFLFIFLSGIFCVLSSSIQICMKGPFPPLI